jgi:hypothetical protein
MMVVTACLAFALPKPERSNRSLGLIRNSYLLNKQMTIDTIPATTLSTVNQVLLLAIMTSLTSEKFEFSEEISSKTLYTSIFKTRRKTIASPSLYTLKVKSVHQCSCLAFNTQIKKVYAFDDFRRLWRPTSGDGSRIWHIKGVFFY